MLQSDILYIQGVHLTRLMQYCLQLLLAPHNYSIHVQQWVWVSLIWRFYYPGPAHKLLDFELGFTLIHSQIHHQLWLMNHAESSV